MIKDLEARLGYKFSNISLLLGALSHSSYANEHYHDGLKSNERLEFLGDSILGMVVAEYLYRNFPDRPEGELTRMRADMVCETALAAIARTLNLGSHLLLGKGEEAFGGRERPSILADAVESVIAASYLDGGMDAARGIINRFVLSDVPVTRMHNVDYKTALQERVQQKKNQVLTYRPLGEQGPDHHKEFMVEVLLNGKVAGTGSGTSKKRAEQAAAKAAMQALFGE
jgi:ribonuclease-3